MALRTGLITLLLVVYVSALQAQHHYADWVQQIQSNENTGFNNILYDGEDLILNGSWIDAGAFAGIELPNYSGASGLLVKINTDGSPLWYSSIAGDGFEAFFDMAFDSKKDIVMVGFSTSNDSVMVNGVTVFEPETEWISRAVVAKFSGQDGRLLWYKTFFSNQEYSGVNANRLAVDASDNIYVAGYHDASFTVDNIDVLFTQEQYGSPAFMVKLNADGTALWGKSFDFVAEGYGGFSTIKTMKADSESLYCGMEYSKPMLINGDTLSYEGEYAWNAVIKVSQSTGAVTKYTDFGSALDQKISRMALDKDGNLILTGFFYGESDFSIGDIALKGNVSAEGFNEEGFVAKFDKDLDVKWAKAMGGSFNDRAFNVKVAPDNRIFVSGGFDSYSPFKYDGDIALDSLIPNSLSMFQLILTKDADLIKAFAMYGNDQYSMIDYSDFVVLPDYRVFAVGSTLDSVEFTEGNYVFSSHNAGFVMKWDLSEGITSAESTTELPLHIFPNPSTGTVYFDSSLQPTHYQLYDGKGQPIKADKINPQSNELNLGGLENGMYILRLSTRSGVYSKRVLIRK